MSEFKLDARDLIPFGTAVLGFVLGGISALVRSAREKRKAADELLFILLKLRAEIRRQNPDLLMNIVHEVLVKKFGASVEALASRGELQDILARAIQASTQPHLLDLLKQLEDAIQKIAPFKPILAYRLSGGDVFRFRAFLDSYYESILKTDSVRTDLRGPEIVGVLKRETVDFVSRDALKGVARDLRAVAIVSSWWRWFSVVRAIRRQDAFTTEEIAKQFSEEWETHFTAMFDKVAEIVTTTSRPSEGLKNDPS